MLNESKRAFFDIVLAANALTFKVELSHTVFKGYEVVWDDRDDSKDYHGEFPQINEGDLVKVVKKEKEQKFTQPPAHFSEAKLVKLMEEVGIGRPSTYSSTIETLKERKYINNNAD